METLNLQDKYSDLIKIIAEYFSVDVEVMFADLKNRKKEHVMVRQMTWWFLKLNTPMSLATLGSIFKKDHATVLAAIKAIKGFLKNNREIIKIVNDLTELTTHIFINHKQIEQNIINYQIEVKKLKSIEQSLTNTIKEINNPILSSIFLEWIETSNRCNELYLSNSKTILK